MYKWMDGMDRMDKRIRIRLTTANYYESCKLAFLLFLSVYIGYRCIGSMDSSNVEN